MAFIEEPRFPDDIAINSSFGPSYSTSKGRNLGGYEVSNRNWTMPLHEGDVSFIKNQEQLDELLTFFHYAAGMHNGFRFKNFNDFVVTEEQGTLVSLTATTWQMYKNRTYGALVTPMKISKPIAGATIVGSGAYSYDTTTGIVTKLSGADPTGWFGEFDFPVRFNVDRMLPVWLSFEVYDIDSIPIIEIRL